ncbi:MAG TPA: alpha/beta fold hydrolase [Solirubrobacterales bacterium]|nr:alpha/beta fold hydrolase [Solirubrobacterales bacterium]
MSGAGAGEPVPAATTDDGAPRGGRPGGVREPLLLIHGLGAGAGVWDPVVPLLAADFEVIALDLPGFGGAPSLPPGVEPTAAALAGALRDQLAARGIERPHVAGNSLGGWVGLELGRIGAARSVTCLSPAGLWRKPIGPSESMTREWARRLRPAVGLALRIGPVRRRALSTFSAHPKRVPAAAGRELVLGWIDADGYDGANKAMREHVFQPAGYPAPAEVPVTVAWAELDQLVGPPRPECRPAGARFVVLPDVGHTPMWDDPELVARTILEGSGRVGSEEPVTSEGGAP